MTGSPDKIASATLKALLENPYLIHPPKSTYQERKKDEDWIENFDVTAAFLGPTLWSKTLPYDGDFKTTYMDLDEFFSGSETSSMTPHQVDSHKNLRLSDSSSNDSCSNQKIEIKKALATIPGKEFDPSSKSFSDNELKPQPMFKKCKKQFVPSEMKDERYWARRKKNNLAAKRSRDARRIKENQIVMRAAYLEKENNLLKKEMEALRQENVALLSKINSMEKEH